MYVPRLASNLPRLARTKCFSTSAAKSSYEDTVQNLKIGKHTRVLYQGFTGKVATQNAKESIEYGTNIVGGVKPGGSGEHLGLPVLSTVREAKEQLKPDATAIYVAAPHAGKAIEEAIEAEIPLIVAVAEHIPLHDILRVRMISKSKRIIR
jgi:succinyl-CoA synthetase alpha subunit